MPKPMSISELAEHNPWWLDRTAISKDRLISEYDSSSF